MLDQSFSHENFRIILDVENRKGRYLEDSDFFDSSLFKESREITNKIIDLNKDIDAEFWRLKSLQQRSQNDYKEYNSLIEIKEKLIKEREEKRTTILSTLSEITNSEKYSIKIEKSQIKFGSQLYSPEKKPEHYFVLKQLQRNIYKTFKVKQATRRDVISQLKVFLNDGFPKVIIRTDIKRFYESVPHSRLLSQIEENSLLSYPSKRIIKDILNQYWKILVADGIKKTTDERMGLPRGIGISAYLSELYLRDIDRKLSALDGVSFYARYVDDIVIIITPQRRNENISTSYYKRYLSSTLQTYAGLTLNEEKTMVLDLRKDKGELKSSKKVKFNYLGYLFELGYIRKALRKDDGIVLTIEKIPLTISMSDKKFHRYKNKLETAFADFATNKIKYAGRETGIKKLLIRRIKFLTNNFKLFRRKKNIFVGIYFSNEFLNNYKDLHKLDDLLKREIIKINIPGNEGIVNELEQLSFVTGFREKRFQKFHYESFENGKVLSIWKNL